MGSELKLTPNYVHGMYLNYTVYNYHLAVVCNSSASLVQTELYSRFLRQGISEPVFYGYLVYKFKIIVGKPSLSDQFKKIIKRYKRVEYMRQSAYLVVNPIMVYSYYFPFDCMTVGQASDSVPALV